MQCIQKIFIFYDVRLQAELSSSIEEASDQEEAHSEEDAQSEAATVDDDDDESPQPSLHEQRRASTTKTSTQNNTEKSSSKNKQKPKHIMISYQWDHQDMMLKVGAFFRFFFSFNSCNNANVAQSCQ